MKERGPQKQKCLGPPKSSCSPKKERKACILTTSETKPSCHSWTVYLRTIINNPINNPLRSAPLNHKYYVFVDFSINPPKSSQILLLIQALQVYVKNTYKSISKRRTSLFFKNGPTDIENKCSASLIKGIQIKLKCNLCIRKMHLFK